MRQALSGRLPLLKLLLKKRLLPRLLLMQESLRI
jgi:hypothetical protein